MSKETTQMFKVDLQMFNDGGASGAEGTVATTENAPKAESKPSGSSRRSKSGEFDKCSKMSIITVSKDFRESMPTTSLQFNHNL